MLLQEQIEGKAKPALGQSFGTVMAGHARVGKQPRAGFPLVEILGLRGRRQKEPGNAKGEQDINAESRSRHTV
jgi:hypothetical protein